MSLTIDDKPLKDILKRLYYPDSPYEFSVLSADILGQVYEQFLGKVIRLTSDHRAVVEDKPEVKKAGGVFYTPTYIVDYIVKNTVGKLLEGKTPKKVDDLRILDPACGSGSFLIGAYQYLLDWHLKWYAENNPDKHAKAKKPTLYKGSGDAWHLTTAERKRILLNNIYGVDIDSQAVEVTKLSLLLKVLEGETGESLNQQRKLFHERALPDLGGNIKCGNSLIGPDFYDGKQISMLDEEEMHRVNVFDWQAEFPEIFKAGGFDAVIGNPPWGASFMPEEKEYFRTHYENFHVRTPESFNYFIGKMFKLTRLGGYDGAIIPSSFLNQHEFWKTRKTLVEKAKLFRICNLGDSVFEKVTAPSCILVFGTDNKQYPSLFFDLRKNERNSLSLILKQEHNGQDASSVGQDDESYILQVRNDRNILRKCYQMAPLRDIVEDVATGVSSGLDAAFIYKENEAKKLGLEKFILRKLIVGGEINRYSLRAVSQKVIIYVTKEIDIKEYPNCYAALEKYRDRLKIRVETKSGLIPWYSLYRPRRKKLFEQPKILVRQTANHIIASYDSEGWYCLKSGIVVQLPSNAQIKYEYLLGLLNSRLVKYLYDDLVGEQARVFPEVKPIQLFKLPIRSIDFSNHGDKQMHDRMVQLVEQMLALNKQLPEAKTSHEQIIIQRQIDATDRQIDKMVYELYGLTPEEIAVVEGQ
ncbi:MAG: N-6 DNA methylase [Smithella sp.]